MHPADVNPEATTRVRVGNDVVDLSEPRSRGKSESTAFLRRVFTEAEAAWIRAGEDPDARDRRLWTLWAGKETAFKIFSKVLGTPPVFIHRAFECHPAEDAATNGWGVVRWEGREATLLLEGDRDLLHMVGWAGRPPPPPGILSSSRIQPIDSAALLLDGPDPVNEWTGFLDFHFTEDEARPIHSLPSALVRLLARREAALAIGVEESRVQLICGEGPKGRTPPRLLVDRGPVTLDVSLSHHGRFVAWVLGPAFDQETA
jgi:phosphopantetheinyl transferase (holo-ACP synthase)